MTAQHIELLIQAYAIFSIGLAFYYLARRRLSIGEWFLWGLVTLVFPILGPFVAISARPGPRKRRPTRRYSSRDPKGNADL